MSEVELFDDPTQDIAQRRHGKVPARSPPKYPWCPIVNFYTHDFALGKRL